MKPVTIRTASSTPVTSASRIHQVRPHLNRSLSTHTSSVSKTSARRVGVFSNGHVQSVKLLAPVRSFATSKRAVDEVPEAEVTETKTVETEAKEQEVKFTEVEEKATERATGPAHRHEFQAETRKLLDIVARSLYTEREVFIRELISNASDALEKVRHRQIVGKEIEDPNAPLEINLYVDEKAKTITFQDSGIGMTEAELIKNLGSIGHSGSLDFIKNASDPKAVDIIGQFGVGFYSTFMVGNKVVVYSKSATPGSKGYCWTSDGSGSYDIAEAEGVHRGTKITVYLNEKSTEYSHKDVVEKIIKKYSNFVTFKIALNGAQVNTLKPLWAMSKNQITEAEHREFYQFISHAYDEPMYHLHFGTDSPINIRSLFYIGQQHSEKFGMGRMESGINLFSRKVLIQSKAKILPDFLRFVKGVVDSEDLPLNLSREHLQDSGLIKRIGAVLTKRILKWLEDEARKDPVQYNKFFMEFGNFIREGVVMDWEYKEDLAKLLRYESSANPADTLTSFDDYIKRMPKGQEEIYYLIVPDRQMGETSPYYESFKARNTEVLFMYTPLDDFVMTNLNRFQGKKLVTVESADAIKALKKLEDKKDVVDATPEKLSADQFKDLSSWIKKALEGKLSSITESERLRDSPAIVVDHISATQRRMMRFSDQGHAPALGKQQLEVNPSHPIIIKLNQLKDTDEPRAKIVVEQIFDNALAAAGLLDDARAMVPRLNKLLEYALSGQQRAEAAEATATAAADSSSTTSTSSTSA